MRQQLTSLTITELQVPRSSSHSPLFQAFFDYHQGAQEKLKFGNTTWENADRHPGERAYDITLDIIEGSAGTLVALIGQDYLYGIPEMQKLLDCYLTLLTDFVKNPTTPAGTGKLYAQDKVDAALKMGQGKSCYFNIWIFVTLTNTKLLRSIPLF
jgi:hybrid polyketide synthase / nonribosomal peptide synthetase ACE1